MVDILSHRSLILVKIIMKNLWNFLIIAIYVSSFRLTTDAKVISIRMPDIRPDHGDQYLCMARRLTSSLEGEYIVEFNPEAKAGRVHHMLMYGCIFPGIYQRDSPNFVWDCGEMLSINNDNNSDLISFEKGSVCSDDGHILYGWALDAPSLKLPPKVGFKVGSPETGINFLILQVHYGHYHEFQKLPDLTDNSGLVLELKSKADAGITRQAGVLILMSMGSVKPGFTRHQIWADMEEDIGIHPFRYRVHTHKLGSRVLGAKLNPNYQLIQDEVMEEDSIIGIGDPQKPQMFHPVNNQNMIIGKGDIIYAHCEFNNTNPYSVQIGNTGDNEMCNFYLMYWTDSPKLLSKSSFYSIQE